MKNNVYKSGLAVLVAGLALTACDPEIDAPKATKGEANFTKYIAVGNSLTAGFMDNGLYLEGQVNSYPNILAQQFKLAGGGEFVQPLFAENEKNGSGFIMLTGFTPTGLPVTTTVTANTAVMPNGRLTKFNGTVQNLGVPGIAVNDVKTAGYGSAQGNQYFERFADNPGQTYLQKIQTSTDHTFFTNWLGNNDVLGFATTGGFSGTITDRVKFEQNYTEVIDALTNNGAKGLVATIPDVSGLPFFTTVGPQIKAALSQTPFNKMYVMTGGATQLNQRVEVPLSDIKDATGGSVLFPLTGAAYAPFIGQPNYGKIWRDAYKMVNPPVPFSLFLLAAGVDTTQRFGVTSGNPWPSLLVLDKAELQKLKDETAVFNAVITGRAAAKNLAVFDANAYFNSIQPGFNRNSVGYTTVFISGNLFSMDGIHPTPRGYAFVANEMIKAINFKYGSTIPTVDETQYRAILFPN